MREIKVGECYDSRMRSIAAFVIATALACGTAYAVEPQALAKARALYNAADYDGAIAAAAQARTEPGAADAAALVEARARLERYRRSPESADPADLTAARQSLSAIHPSALSPRDQVDFFVGLGQSLYLAELFGAAAELFETALERGTLLPPRDRLMLLDWWATALDREAQGGAPDRRARLFGQIAMRMEEELRRDPGSAAANYWLVVAARGAGDLDAAGDKAVAAWVRATIDPSSQALRSDVDRLVTQALIPERARTRPAREQVDATETLRAQWELVKAQWK